MNTPDIFGMLMMIFILGIFVSFVVSLGVAQAHETAKRELELQQLSEKDEHQDTASKIGTD